MHKNIQENRIRDAGKFPKVILLDTISFCNLKCSMCGHKDMKRKKSIMSMSLFKKIIDEIAARDKNVRVWLVFFGEMLILKKETIFTMIKYAKDSGLRDVVLNSNANLLNKEKAEVLITSGLDALYVGIDAFNPDTYSKIRIGGDYHKVVDNVKMIIRLKKEMKVDKPKIFVQFVEMEENQSEVKGFVKFWKGQGAIAKVRPKVSWAGLVSAPSQKVPLNKRWPCHWAMQTMSIVDDGRVVCCAVDVDARFIAGDINKQSLYEIWNGKLKNLRNYHKQGEFDKLPSFCRDCSDWQSARADYY